MSRRTDKSSTHSTPDFLIIGAMKAGTTTLYRDLLANPAVFFPIDKEPSNLIHDEVLTDAGRNAYARLYAAARHDQVCGDGSTGYAKLPDHPGVPARAAAVLKPDFKALYLVRHPIRRIISHHRHELANGTIDIADINEAVRVLPRFIDYSRYAVQARPWLDAIGSDRLRIIVFEEYIRSRTEAVAEVSRFLGVTPHVDNLRTDVAYNRSDAKPILTGPLRAVAHSGLYRRLIRPWLSVAARERLRTAVLPAAPPPQAPPSAGTIEFLRDSLAEDGEHLGRIMGRAEPVWDLSAGPGRGEFGISAI